MTKKNILDTIQAMGAWSYYDAYKKIKVATCDICNGAIMENENYCQIVNFKFPDASVPSRSRYTSFHEPCFERIAGKKYMA